MSRPALSDIDRTDSGWLTKVNANFEKLLDAPFPMDQEASTGALPNAKLYKDCYVLVGDVLYQSDGTSWGTKQLNFIADLDTGTATVSDIKTAYNNLLADLQAKGWMA